MAKKKGGKDSKPETPASPTAAATPASPAAAEKTPKKGAPAETPKGKGKAAAAPAAADGVVSCGMAMATPMSISPVPGMSSVRVIEVSAGWQHTLFLADGGSVYSFGIGLFGRLGHGDSYNLDSPRRIAALSRHNITQVSAGGHHSLALSSAGSVFAWGSDGQNQLGLGPGKPMFTTKPQLVSALEKTGVLQLSAGGHHSLAVTDTGVVYAWGQGDNGRLGLGSLDDVDTPTVVELPPSVEVSAGGMHSLFLTVDGQVFAAGWGESGATGRGAASKEGKGKGKAVAGSSDFVTPGPAEGLDGVKIVQISAGYSHSVVLAESGEVFAFGSATCGRLGVGDITRRPAPTRVPDVAGVVQVSAGYRHTLYLTDSGEVYGAGYGHGNRLGFGADETDKLVPAHVPLGGRKTRDLSAGDVHSMFILDEAGPPKGVKSAARLAQRTRAVYRKLVKECNELFLASRGVGTKEEPVVLGQHEEYKRRAQERDEYKARHNL